MKKDEVMSGVNSIAATSKTSLPTACCVADDGAEVVSDVDLGIDYVFGNANCRTGEQSMATLFGFLPIDGLPGSSVKNS